MLVKEETYCSRLGLWGSEVTDDVLSLARTRILDGGNLVNRDDLPRRVIKMALIVMRELNPMEDMSNEEEAILMGVGKNKITKMKSERAFIQLVNR